MEDGGDWLAAVPGVVFGRSKGSHCVWVGSGGVDRGWQEAGEVDKGLNFYSCPSFNSSR